MLEWDTHWPSYQGKYPDREYMVTPPPLPETTCADITQSNIEYKLPEERRNLTCYVAAAAMQTSAHSYSRRDAINKR